MKLIGIAGGALLAAMVAGPVAAQDLGLPVGSDAPRLAVKDLDGRPVDLGQWVGKKPVLIEFWATWCENCEALLPKLASARARVGDRVEFIGINVTVNQTPERVRRYMAEHELPFRVLYDTEGASVRAFAAPATSYVVLIDRGGKILYTGVGPDQEFDASLDRAAGITQ
ncbi:MAG: TlpA family protein disulfide reductase [Gemmatimonadota bacterium]|nr:TlpA family protein disulfide reductase [Gemmatimonadota bacterium]